MRSSLQIKRLRNFGRVCVTFEEFVASANKMNESNADYTPIERGRGVESIRNCWQRRIQPAIQKFAGVIYDNPPTSGEVKDDALMDLYYSRIHETYSSCSHTYPNGCPKTFHKLMKAYHILSEHPKYEVKFPVDGSKPPSMHPNSIRKNNAPDSPDDWSVHPD